MHGTIIQRPFSRRIFTASLAAAAFVRPSFAAGQNGMDAATEQKLKAVLAGAHRSAQNKARDQYRHPLETLKFFGLTEDMAVMEVAPGGGWYTEVLAPLLKDKGRYIGTIGDPANANAAKSAAAFTQRFGDAAIYGKVETGVLSPGTGKLEPVAPGTLDMVLTFRNIHNWMSGGSAEQMFQAFHAALKPGGWLGVVEHRAATDAPQDPKASKGYVREDFAVALAEKAGFKLVGKSEVNANPKDTKDYAKGVWTLPPVLTEGDTDRDKYTAIGESDRFTLLFQKA